MVTTGTARHWEHGGAEVTGPMPAAPSSFHPALGQIPPHDATRLPIRHLIPTQCALGVSLLSDPARPRVTQYVTRSPGRRLSGYGGGVERSGCSTRELSGLMRVWAGCSLWPGARRSDCWSLNQSSRSALGADSLSDSACLRVTQYVTPPLRRRSGWWRSGGLKGDAGSEGEIPQECARCFRLRVGWRTGGWSPGEPAVRPFAEASAGRVPSPAST
jgi:hypothetical protein